jgi:predicted ester cyclase
VDEIATPDVVIHANSLEVHGLDGARGLAVALKAAFPDVETTHHGPLSSGDRVAIRWSAEATHGGDYFGTPASGKRVRFEGLDLFHLRDGKIAEVWIEYDNAGVLQQMSALTPAASSVQ